MTSPPPAFEKSYSGARGPSRVPLAEAVWSALVQLRHGRENSCMWRVLRHRGITEIELGKMRTCAENAEKETYSRTRPKLEAICRERDVYRDRIKLGNALAALDRTEQIARKKNLRRLSSVLTRNTRRLVLAWVAHEHRAGMSMHCIDKHMFARMVEDVDAVLDRICQSARG